MWQQVRVLPLGGAASVREMPVKSKSCGEPSLCSRPACIESPQGVPGPQGRPGAQSTVGLRQEFKGGTGHRAMEGQHPRLHREKGTSAFFVPCTSFPYTLPWCFAEKFPLPCFSESPEAPLMPPLLFRLLAPNPGGSWTGAGQGRSCC